MTGATAACRFLASLVRTQVVHDSIALFCKWRSFPLFNEEGGFCADAVSGSTNAAWIPCRKNKMDP
jgi:hypothetical protein